MTKNGLEACGVFQPYEIQVELWRVSEMSSLIWWFCFHNSLEDSLI